jgi:Tol biopolymer transport system component
MSKIKFLIFLFILGAAGLLGLSYLPALKKFPKTQIILLSFRKTFLALPTPFGIPTQTVWLPQGNRLVFSLERFSLGGKKLWSLYSLNLQPRKVSLLAYFSSWDEIQKFIPSNRGDFLVVQFLHQGKSYLKLLNLETGIFLPIPAPANFSFSSTTIANSSLAFLPDGRKFLFAGENSNGFHLCLYDMDAGTSSALNLPTNSFDGTWAPAGDKILFLTSNGNQTAVMTASPDGSHAALIYSGDEICCARYSPYGKEIAFFEKGRESSTLAVIKSDGSERDFTRGLPEDVASLNWSPDGSAIFFQAKNKGEPWELYAYFVKDASIKKLTFKGENFDPEISPDGNTLAFVSDQVFPEFYSIYLQQLPSGKKNRETGWLFF